MLLQKSADQGFITDCAGNRLNEKGRLMIDHHTKAMALLIHIESHPNILLTIADALARSKSENRGRPKKGFHSQPRTSEIRIFNDDQNPADSWKQVAAELNKTRSFSQNPD
jgi:hypothetical protein